jgi:hypothetical protein
MKWLRALRFVLEVYLPAVFLIGVAMYYGNKATHDADLNDYANVSFVYLTVSGALLFTGAAIFTLATRVLQQEKRIRDLEQRVGQLPPNG